MAITHEDRPTNVDSLKNGRQIPGDNMTNSAIEVPSWVDKKKIERAKELYKEHSSSIQFGHLSGLMMIFLYTKNIKPFLFTGNSSNFVSLLRRYISTADHVRQWYTGDIWNPEDPAHKSIMIVRNMHKNVALKMRDNDATTKDFLYVSQFGMAMTLFAFNGLIVLHPLKLGINWKKEDMDCFVHFWRSVGYLLGTEGKYNICSGNYDDTLLLYRDILENEIKPGIRNPLRESVNMARDIVTVFSCFTPFLTWQSLCEYWVDELTIQRNFILSLYDRISVLWFRFAFGFLMWYQWMRILSNRRAQTAFNKVIKNMPYYENLVLNYEMKLSQKLKEC